MPPEKFGDLTVVRPDFTFDLKNVVKLRSLVDSGIASSPAGIVLDLSKVFIFDSLGHKTVQNLHANFKKRGGRLIVICGDPVMLDQLRAGSSSVEAVATEEEARRRAASARPGEDFEEAGLECPICGNDQFPKRVVRRENFDPVWSGKSIFPVGKSRVTAQIVDFNRKCILVCNDCLMASFYPDDFHRRSGGEKKQAVFNKDIKDLLVKSTNRRRALLQRSEIEKEAMIDPGRSDRHLEMAYRLCADCLSSITFDRSLNRHFESGLSHLLVNHFCAEGKKEAETLKKADVAFVACLENPPEGHPGKTWQSYYYRLILSFLLARPGEARGILQAFQDAGHKVQGEGGFEFWYSRAAEQHHRGIQNIANRHAV